VRLPAQLIHGDLGGNVLFAPGEPPAVIDFSPYWRPAGLALAIAAVDALTWSGADPAILDQLADQPELDQLLARAHVGRLVTEVVFRRGDPDPAGLDTVARTGEPVTSLILSRLALWPGALRRAQGIQGAVVRACPVMTLDSMREQRDGQERDAISRNLHMKEATMALVFIAIDPDTGGDHCPAVFIEDETGDLIFQGWTVTDPKMLADVARHSPIADDESVVRLPARMREIVREALNGQAATVQRADRRDHHVGGALGDARRVHTS
jgi:hypothetical protein